MRTRGLTTRSLGAAIGVSGAAVTGWTKGAMPRPDAAKRLADFFECSTEDLFNDSRSVPPEPVPASIAEAKAAADRLPEDQPLARQAVFEKTLARTHHSLQMREIAGRLRAQAAVWMRWADELDHPPADRRKN